MSEQAAGLFILALVPLGWAFYVLPTIIAFRRHHPNRWLIAAINVFLGATGIGWAGALVWAFHAAHRTEQADGSHGGESGLNLFVNDVRRVSVVGSGAGPAERNAPASAAPLSTSRAVADLERLGRLRGTGHLSEAEFASLKASVLQRVR
jgi:hypothetical protein